MCQSHVLRRRKVNKSGKAELKLEGQLLLSWEREEGEILFGVGWGSLFRKSWGHGVMDHVPGMSEDDWDPCGRSEPGQGNGYWGQKGDHGSDHLGLAGGILAFTLGEMGAMKGLEDRSDVTRLNALVSVVAVASVWRMDNKEVQGIPEPWWPVQQLLQYPEEGWWWCPARGWLGQGEKSSWILDVYFFFIGV